MATSKKSGYKDKSVDNYDKHTQSNGLRLKGSYGDDIINGGDGNDRIDAGRGDDFVDGGDGNDRISGKNGNDIINGGDGNDYIDAGKGDDIVDGGAGNDRISGKKGNDIINGGDGNDYIDAGKGNDFVDGGAGDDYIDTGKGNDFVDGGTGDDYIDTGKGNDFVDGGAGDDYIDTGKGNDFVDGGAGNDQVFTEDGDDTAHFEAEENWESSNFYDGGKGTDTLNLTMTYGEALTAKDELAAFDTFINTELNSHSHHNKHSHKTPAFEFTTFDLSVRNFESYNLNLVNTTAIAVDDVNTTDEDTEIGGNLLINDYDNDHLDQIWVSDYDELSASGVPVTVSSNGDYTYNPTSVYQWLALDETVVDTFSYTIRDLAGATHVATASITVVGTNDDPIVQVQGNKEIYEDTLLEGQLIATDIDSDDDSTSLTYILIDDGLSIPGFTFNEDGSYSIDANNVGYQSLAVGDVVQYGFRWQAEDKHGALSELDTVIITVTGTNDAPKILLEEDQGVDEGESIHGQVIANDIDRDDDSASLTYILVDGSDIPGFVFNEDGSYSLNADINDYKYLARDETVTYVFRWRAEDSHGVLSTVDEVEVTITGTNDTPVVAYTDLSGEFIELLIPNGFLHDTGTISFTDANTDDIHSISSVTAPDGTLGTLTARVTSDTTDKALGTEGLISWSYSVDSSDLEYLAQGENKINSFTITLDDGNGGLVDRVVEITITGTNDAPIIVAQSDQSIEEDSILNGQVVATDIDSDDDAASLTYILLSGNTIPGFSFNTDGSYTLDASIEEYQHLAQDQTVEHTFRYRVEDSHSKHSSSVDDITITITGTNDTPTVTSALTTYTFNLLQGASDVDDGAQLHIEDVVETTGEDGWSIQGNTMRIDSVLYQELYESGETKAFDFSYNIVDEHGAKVSQTSRFEVEGKALPNLVITTTAGSSANIVMLTVIASALDDTSSQLFYLNFDNLNGASIFDTSGNNVTAGLSNFTGERTFEVVLPQNQDADFLLDVTITADDGAQNIQSAEIVYDVSSSTELLSFSSENQNIWGDFDGDISWHEYIPFIGEVSQEWNAETKSWDLLDVDPWFNSVNIVDIDINHSNILEIMLSPAKVLWDGAKLAVEGAEWLLDEAYEYYDNVSAQFQHISTVSAAWLNYTGLWLAYQAANTAYTAGKLVFDLAEDVFELAESAIASLESAYNWSVTNSASAKKAYTDSAWVFDVWWAPTVTLYDPLKLAAWGAAELLEASAWTALNIGQPIYDTARGVFDTAQDTYNELSNEVDKLEDRVDTAYDQAIMLENAMHNAGYFGYTDGDIDDIALALTKGTAEEVAGLAAVGTAEVALLAAKGAETLAEEAYNLAEAGFVEAMDLVDLDFSTKLKVDVDLYTQIGLQIDFEVSLGSVDTEIDYMITSNTYYNQTTNVLSILPTMTNMTTGNSVAYSTISPNLTFYAAILFDVTADLEIYMDAYLSALGFENFLDLSPNANGITYTTTVSTDMINSVPDLLLPDGLEDGKLVLVDFDSTKAEPFEVPFIGDLTGDALSIELALPTVETDGLVAEYAPSFFEEGDLLSVDFSEISSAIFDMVNAKLDYSEEFQAMYGINSLGDSSTIDDLANSLVDAFLLVLEDNLDSQSTAAPIFILDMTDETNTSLFHVNTFPDTVITDTLSEDTANFGFYTSYGESEPVIKVNLDIDQLVAVIINKLVGNSSPVVINPLDIGFGLSTILELAELDEETSTAITSVIDFGFALEAADIDVFSAANFSQEFTLSVDDMSYAITFTETAVDYKEEVWSEASDTLDSVLLEEEVLAKDAETLLFSANTEGAIDIQDASQYDVDGNGTIDYSLSVVPTAMFSNDTEVGLSMGYSIELLQAELSAGLTLPLDQILGELYPNLEIPVVDINVGPLLTIQGDLDILDVDVFETRFDLELSSDTTEILTVGVTDDTMFVA